MVEIRKLRADDFDELFEVLTKTFENKYKHPMYFDKEQPKMWVRDDVHMSRHTGIFENGRLVSVIGVYPLPLTVDGEKFMFYTTGNVATLPGFEGKGYFTKLFDLAMREIEELGADGARLGGARQRYGRYGFEGGGTLYKFAVSSDNVKYTAKGIDSVGFTKVERDDTEALKYCYGAMKKKKVYVDRSAEDNYRDMYLAMCTKSHTPYIVTRGEKRIGYLCISNDGRSIGEFAAESAVDLYDAVCAHQRASGNFEVFVEIPPYMTEELRLFCNGADRVDVITPSRFKFLNYERITGALLKLKAKSAKLPTFDYKINIKDYGTVRLYHNSEGAGCERCAGCGNISLTHSEAIRLLFSYTPCELVADIPHGLSSALPLPLSWATLDYV